MPAEVQPALVAASAEEGGDAKLAAQPHTPISPAALAQRAADIAAQQQIQDAQHAAAIELERQSHQPEPSAVKLEEQPVPISSPTQHVRQQPDMSQQWSSLDAGLPAAAASSSVAATSTPAAAVVSSAPPAEDGSDEGGSEEDDAGEAKLRGKASTGGKRGSARVSCHQVSAALACSVGVAQLRRWLAAMEPLADAPH